MTQEQISLTVNGQKKILTAPPMKRLLDVLREDLQLTGTKEGCGEGECGACSVFIDGILVNSCLIPAAQAANRTVQTIEGIGSADALHPIQEAFLKAGGAQCGICTPGMIMAALALLQKNPQPTLEQIREGLAGNLCRCTGYTKIYSSVMEAADLLAKKSPGSEH